MKVYIFKPAEEWLFCGGGRAMVANSMEEVKAMFPDDIMLEREPEDDPERGNHDKWVLVGTVDAPSEMEARVILDDWNWG